ncbi:MAG: bifunctional metallophosphatase/5'-nucleotidase [Gammaproteobacteria bacterium]|nr:bifunctional metallophosphatase/5'-nucleotidase [Gammaproteobacteria bacterium]
MKFLLFSLAALLSACAVNLQSNASQLPGLTFIHLNDTYRVADVEDGTRGGFARAVTVIRQAQGEGRDVHVLHAGDLLSPSLESQVWFGGQMVSALNFVDEIAPTYFVAGNHEFDIREPDIAFFINAVRSSAFDWLGDNYTLQTGDDVADQALQRAFTVKHGDRTIGVFALTMHPLDGGTRRPYVEYDRDYVANAERVIRQFEAQGVDLIIGLTHLRMANDIELAELRARHPALQFIVGGHEHEVASREQSDTSAAIFKGSSNARVIWRIDVDFGATGDVSISASELALDASIPKDPAYQGLEDEWRAELLRLYPIVDARVGEAAARFDAREETIRNEESAWANFIVDQARGAFGAPVADFAFINSGSIRIDDYIMGDILYEDIARTFGFSSFLRWVTLNGAEFKTLMEAGYVGEGEGNFPQVSGFRVCVDRRLPERSRIVSLQVPAGADWQEIDANRQYTLVMPDFLYQNNDGYVIPDKLKDPDSRTGAELKYLVLDAIIKAQQLGQKVGQEVDPKNPRFVALGPDREACW